MPHKTVESIVSGARLSQFHIGLLVLCSLLMAIDGYDMISYGTVIVSLMGEWKMNPVIAGTLGSMALVGMLVGGLVISPLADRFGRRPVMITCVSAASVFSLSCAFTTGPIQLGAARFIVGMFLGALVPNVVALISEFSPRASKALLVTLVSSFYGAGGVAAAVFAINVEPLWTWRGVFYMAGLPLLLVPVLVKVLPESPEFLAINGQQDRLIGVLKKVDPSSDLADVVATPRATLPKARVAQLLTRGNVLNSLLIWIFFAMCMLLSYGLNTWLPKLMQAAGYELRSALWTLVVLNIGGMAGAIFGGWLADRWNFRNTLVTYFVAASLSMVGLSFHPDVVILNLLLLIAGGATIGALAIVHAFAVEFYPTEVRSTGVGWAAGMGRIGAIGGPTLGGALLSLNLPFQQNFVALAVPGIIGAAAATIVAKRKFMTAMPEPAQPVPVLAS